jgi:hypothetical protein
MASRPEYLPQDSALLVELGLAQDGEIENLPSTVAMLKVLIFGPRSERVTTIGTEQLPLQLGSAVIAVPPAANDDGGARQS